MSFVNVRPREADNINRTESLWLADCKKAEGALESLKIWSHLPNVDINRDHIKQFPL